MPICIECRHLVNQLYTSYSKADDRSLGKGVRLTQCPRCKHFADKYVEHDYVVLFIDLVLIKPQVYRHLLFNRLGHGDDKLDPSITRLGILLLLFDVYLTWARIEKANPSIPSSSTTASHPGHAGTSPESSDFLAAQPLLLQYLFFLLLCTLTTVSFHLPIRLLATYSPFPSSILPRHSFPNRISAALVVSSCTKLFPILMVIWEYDLPLSASAVSWAVIVNNIAALEIVLDCGYGVAAALVGIGSVVRAIVAWALLKSAGLAPGRGLAETGDLLNAWKALGGFLGTW